MVYKGSNMNKLRKAFELKYRLLKQIQLFDKLGVSKSDKKYIAMCNKYIELTFKIDELIKEQKQ